MKKTFMIIIILGGALMAGFGTSILMSSDASAYAEEKTATLQQKTGIDVDWKDNKTVGTVLLAGGVVGFVCAFMLSRMLFGAAALLILAGLAPLWADWHAIMITFPLVLTGVAILIFNKKIM